MDQSKKFRTVTDIILDAVDLIAVRQWAWAKQHGGLDVIERFWREEDRRDMQFWEQYVGPVLVDQCVKTRLEVSIERAQAELAALREIPALSMSKEDREKERNLRSILAGLRYALGTQVSGVPKATLDENVNDQAKATDEVKP